MGYINRLLSSRQIIIMSAWFLSAATLFLLAFNQYAANPNKCLNTIECKLIDVITTTEPINFNTATEDELVKFKGIGAKRAKQIVNYRIKHGKFKSLDDIKRVPGLGTRFLEENKELIVLSDFAVK